jgi:hypothetical protein
MNERDESVLSVDLIERIEELEARLRATRGGRLR